MYDNIVSLIKESKYIVLFTGAGVSTDAGIPDFRSSDYIHPTLGKIPLEYALSRTCLDQQPEVFYDYFWKNLWFDAMPNHEGYNILTEICEKYHLEAIITQNIDGLHHQTPVDIVELHGNLSTFYCENGHSFDQSVIRNYLHQIPKCPICEKMLRPDIVLYEEALDAYTIESAIRHIKKCDLLIIAGTSLNVYPAASFVHLNTQCKKIMINLEIPHNAPNIDYMVEGRFIKVMQEIKKRF